MLTQLRKTIAALERPPGLENPCVRPFAIPAIDTVLGGGLVGGALHEIAASNEAHVATATGFALGQSLAGKSIVWITEDLAIAENGVAYGHGFEEFGIAPERLLIVTTARTRDLLWAVEETLRCRTVGTVIAELRHEKIDAVALRRLSLAASERNVLALLLRATPRSDDLSTAATRWIINAASSCVSHGPGPPRFAAHLVRNRRGPLGSWMLEWSDTDERFVLASTHLEPMVLPAIDRSVYQVA